MSTEEIKRLDNDLTTMRQAMRFDKPYDAADVPYVLLIGLGALIAVPLLIFSPWPPRLILLLSLSPGLLAYARRAAATGRNQAQRPNLWKEYKLGTIAAVGVGLAAGGWLLWSQQVGASFEATRATILFCIGIALMGIGAMDSTRRYYVVMGFVVVMFAMAMLSLEPHNIAPAGAGLIAFVALSTAAYIWSQTTGKTTSHDESEHSA